MIIDIVQFVLIFIVIAGFTFILTKMKSVLRDHKAYIEKILDDVEKRKK